MKRRVTQKSPRPAVTIYAGKRSKKPASSAQPAATEVAQSPSKPSSQKADASGKAEKK